jgi:hypothetical protein
MGTVGAFLQLSGQLAEFLGLPFPKLLDRLPIHSGAALVAPHRVKRTLQVVQGIDFVDQSKPFASFDPVLQGRQHTFCPNRQFHPPP